MQFFEEAVRKGVGEALSSSTLNPDRRKEKAANHLKFSNDR